MANAIKWEATWTSRGVVLDAEIDSLGLGGVFSGATAGGAGNGTALDNTTNLDQTFAAVIILGSFDPAANGVVSLYYVQSIDGTTYEDAPSSATVQPGFHQLLFTLPVLDTSSAKRIETPPFVLGPGKYKFVLRNSTSANFASSGNTVTVYSTNDEIQ